MIRVPSPALVGLLWLIWGATFLIIKIGVAYTTPYVFSALRVAVSASVVALLLAVRPRRKRTAAPARRTVHRYGAGLALLNVATYLPLQTAGIAISDVGFSAILVYTQPLLVAVLARPILGERLARWQFVGLILGWVGVATVAKGGLQAGSAHPLGIALLLLSAVCWAGGSVLFKTTPREIDLWNLLLWQNVYALPVLVVISIVAGGTTTWSATLLMTGLLVGAGAGVGGFALLFTLLRRGQANMVSSWIFAVPIVSSVLGVVVHGERWTPALLFGGALVGTGVYLVTTRGAPQVMERTASTIETSGLRGHHEPR